MSLICEFAEALNGLKRNSGTDKISDEKIKSIIAPSFY